ncbi:putative GPI anchored protein [Aspergillus candidus]|uniref:GPI anchored protein n=1 Tax=Aspergillus candidus TaxID=41067 RepID=A0A2I2F1Z4_ASPCN|nr:hypothetical protein BDW47DRAFT_128873 [Aspergillus candidus]PLB34655.1 hypothetical protein BDW47DRAFT_128873 [Aspergillus candidus]
MRASTLVIAFSALVAAQSGAPSESNAFTLPTASQSTGVVPTSTGGAGGSTGVGSSTTAAPTKSTSSGGASTKTEGVTKTGDGSKKNGASGSPTNSDNGAPMATAGPLSGLLAGAAIALFL